MTPNYKYHTFRKRSKYDDNGNVGCLVLFIIVAIVLTAKRGSAATIHLHPKTMTPNYKYHTFRKRSKYDDNGNVGCLVLFIIVAIVLIVTA